VPRMRFEQFGGIIQIDEPPALVFADRELVGRLGFGESPLWRRRQDHLSAPVEAHFNVTRRCMLACQHCTTASRHRGRELSTGQARRAIGVLAKAGVFHVAFGGGEPFGRSDIFALARYARECGLVPNATTSGQVMTPKMARQCRVFGQVNVSIDGLGEAYRAVRRSGSFAPADRALRMLLDAGVVAGINCVVSQVNFTAVEEIADYAEAIGANELLLLRLKPSGRARQVYHSLKLTPAQARDFYPLLMRLSSCRRVNLQIDCSWVPFVCAHHPSKRLMKLLGVERCGGGDLLLGITPEGRINGCSHHPEAAGQIEQLMSLWERHPHFRAFRGRNVTQAACAACTYFSTCGGGCPLFSLFINGDFNGPDPECPRLVHDS
jgi:radical SAM protein with 4Fe4S-binding SPASM domain